MSASAAELSDHTHRVTKWRMIRWESLKKKNSMRMIKNSGLRSSYQEKGLLLHHGSVRWVLNEERSNIFLHNIHIIFNIFCCFSSFSFLFWISIKFPEQAPLILDILVNAYIAIVCYPDCDVTNFEINLLFPIRSFFYMTIKSRQKIKYLENEKSF